MSGAVQHIQAAAGMPGLAASARGFCPAERRPVENLVSRVVNRPYSSPGQYKTTKNSCILSFWPDEGGLGSSFRSCLQHPGFISDEEVATLGHTCVKHFTAVCPVHAAWTTQHTIIHLVVNVFLL